MPRDEERAKAQQLLLTALRSTPGLGMPEGALRRMTDLGPSLFQEAMKALMDIEQVMISQGGVSKRQTEYHLIEPQKRQGIQEGPLSPLALTVLTRLHRRAEGARAISKALDVELSLVEQVLNELEAAARVSRSQVGMLVIYRSSNTS